MPKVSTIPEILAMDNDDVIKIVRGKIVKRFDRKSGETDKGPWSFENVEITDGKHSVTVSLKNREPLPKHFKVGSLILITAKEGDRGWTGMKAVDEEYQGKTYRKIRVTPTAVIELDNASARTDDDDGNDTDVSASSQERPKDQAQPGNKLSVGPKVMVAKIASLYLVTHRAAHLTKTLIESADKREMEIEEFTSMRSSMFIQGCFDKLYWDLDPIHIMIKKELDAKAPKQKSPAEPTPEDEPPPKSKAKPEPKEAEEDDNIPF